jgi:hypothetical protein
VKRVFAIPFLFALACATVWLFSNRGAEPPSPPPPPAAAASADARTAGAIETEPGARLHVPAAGTPLAISSKPDPILGPKAALEIRVVDARTGEAVAGVDLLVLRPSRPEEHSSWHRELGLENWSALTDEYFPPHPDLAGRARVEVPAGVELRVCVVSPGAEYQADPLAEAALLQNEERAIELRVRRAVDHVLRGRVVDDLSSQPLDSVEVSLIENTQAIQAATTGAAGRFVIPLRSWRTEAARFEKPHYVSRQLKLDSAEDEGELEVRMQHGARVAGHLLDERGEFLTMSSIRLTGEDGYDASCFCDEKGGFQIDEVPPGFALEVQIERWSRHILDADPLPALQQGETRTLELRTSQARKLQGIALDENRKPIPGIVLMLVANRPGAACIDENWFGSSAPQATTDEEGHFLFNDVYSGSWLIGAADVIPARATPLILGAGDQSPIVLEILRGGSIRGFVVDPEGKPVSDAMIEFALEGCTRIGLLHCGPDGGFSAPVQGRWSYRMRALGPPGTLPSKPIEASAGNWNLKLQLEPAAMLLLEVADPAAVQDGASVICIGSNAQPVECSFASDGRAEVSLPPGSYRFLVECGDGRWSRIESASVELGARPQVRRVELQPKASLRIVARDFASAIEVEWSLEGFSLGSIFLDPSSRNECDVPPGQVSIAYRSRGGGAEWKRVVASATPGEPLEVVLHP